ncbi:MAG: DUF116 domain-containing protein [Nitrospinota bacterium]|nr:DUF116 domain-containing protein [Nitrospinota bacterium]
MDSVKNQAAPTKDRKLGDEWADWAGQTEDQKGEIEESKSTFLKYASIGSVLIVAGLLFLWYMIIPRLEQITPALTIIVGIGVVVAALLIFLMLGSVTITALTEKGYLLSCVKENFFFSYLVPVAVRLGKRFGVSRDRMGNSLIKVSNIIVHAKSKNRPENVTVDPNRLLVLLPRCLSKENRKAITETVEKNNLVSFTVAGGSAARLRIKEMRPQAIIAVACERDLVSGLQDVAPKIPVFAIPNKRPEGPCKNTFINIEELEASIKDFLETR